MMPLFLLPATQSIFSFRNCSGMKSLILSHETLVKTTHREDKMRCHEIPLSPFQLFLDIFYRIFTQVFSSLYPLPCCHCKVALKIKFELYSWTRFSAPIDFILYLSSLLGV
ncbi:hypothetical protein QL285_084696 [Trifolium repens]|nr:hypothetical protein QL285_084696 [Trifolium repens]